MSKTRRVCTVGLSSIAVLALLGLLPAAGARPQAKNEEVKKAVIIGGGPVLGVKAAQPGKVAPPQVVPGGVVPLPQANFPLTTSNPENELTDAITLPTDREIRKRLEHAQEDYIQNKLWAEACRLLQSVLDNKEDVFVQVRRRGANNQEKMHWTSAKAEANRLIGTMPSDGLQFYELIYGGAAKKRLTEAKSQGDPQVLAEVAQRYFHTQAGAEATDLLGTYHLDRGRPMMAALCYERLLKREGALQLAPLTLFKAALSFRRGNQETREAADQTWKRLLAKLDREGIRVGDEVASLDQLKKELDRSPALDSTSPFDWTMFRGNSSRSATGRGSAPFLEAHWEMSMIPENLPNESYQTEVKQWVQQTLQLTPYPSEPVLPGFFPVAAGGKLFFRSHWGIHAVDIKTGELAWYSRMLKGSLLALAGNEQTRQSVKDWLGLYRESANQNILFENSTIGSLSTDSVHVYAVDDLTVPPHPLANGVQRPIMGGAPLLMMGPIKDLAERSRLVAINLETGKIEWERGDPGDPGSQPFDTSDLVGSYFLGPPLPLGGKLYVLTEKDSELRLVCLEASKGGIVWTQPLATVRDKMLLDVSRRVHAVHLAYAEGILVCPTNAGAILGVDLLSRGLVWAFPYRERGSESPVNQGAMFQKGFVAPLRAPQNANRHLQKLNSDWKMSAPVIQEGKVVFTAPDGGSIHCLSLRDGEPLWQADRRDDLYLAGVYQGKVVLVGKDSCRALSLADGRRQLWQVSTGQPSGQGVASGHYYYLPLKKGEVCKIDMEKGEVVAHSAAPNNTIPGNLLFYEGDVISQTETFVRAYPQVEYRVAQVDARLRRNPSDPEALTERGELWLYKGDLVDAVADLREALKHQPTAAVLPKTRAKLYTALTELFQQNFAAAERHLAEYRDLCQVPVAEGASAEERRKHQEEQRHRLAGYWSLLAKGREEQGRPLDAFQAYLEFGALAEGNELVPLIHDRSVRVKPNVWAQSRLATLLNKATPEQRKLLEEEIAKRWLDVKTTDDLQVLRRFVDTFGPVFREGREARLQLAEHLMEQYASAEAEQHLLQLYRQKEDYQMKGRALEALARLLTRMGELEGATFYYRILGNDFAKIVIRDGRTGKDLLDELATDKRFLPYLDQIEPPLMSGVLKYKELATGAHDSQPQRLYPLEPRGELVPFFRRHRLVLSQLQQSSPLYPIQLSVIDRNSNAEVWNVKPPPTRNILFHSPMGNPRPYFVQGHLAILYLDHAVCCLDMLGRKKVWERELLTPERLLLDQAGQYQLALDNEGRLQLRNPQGRMENLGRLGPVSGSAICVWTHEGLQGVDPALGTVLWSRAQVPGQTYLFGDEECVYLVDLRNENSVGTVRAVSSRDGTTVSAPDFAAQFQHRQRIVRGRILISENDPKTGMTLRLYDVRTAKDIWLKQVPPKTLLLRGEDNHLLGVVEPTGKVAVIDLNVQQEVFHAVLESASHLEKVNDGVLLQDSLNYYVILNKPGGPPANQAMNQGPSSNLASMRSEWVNGFFYAFDRGRKEIAWFEPVVNQAVLIERFQELPMILFTARQAVAVNQKSMTLQTTVSSRNKRTGKLIYRNADSQLYTPQYEQPFHTLVIDRRSGTIDLRAARMTLRHYVDTSETEAQPSAISKGKPSE